MNFGSAILADDNRNLCPRCTRETSNADLCDQCILDDDIELESGELADEDL